MALSTQPYKGARDFYPEDKRLQKYMFGKLREAVESYGYQEYDAPILEPLELYLAKTGEEIVNEQTYAFEDRGGRQVAIRPEMTPTVSRMVAARRQQLAYPLRWYSIPNLWRYERPQRGRLREHWQLNVDLFGVAGIHAEIEIISVVDAIFKNFGADSTMYEIKINSRPLMDLIISSYFGLDKEAGHMLSKLIDRMKKMAKTDFVEAVDEILTSDQKQAGLTEKILNVLACQDLNQLPEELKASPEAQQLVEVLKALGAGNINNAVFDITIMRGFDYYTGIVFEAYDLHPDNNRSMMGGGRYDGLVGLFGVEPVPTVGFGWGDVTLANFLDLHNLKPVLKPETDVYVALVGDYNQDANLAVQALRNKGLNVAVDISGRKLGDQFKAAQKAGIDNVLIIGQDELSSGNFSLKNLTSGREQKITLDQVCEQLTTP